MRKTTIICACILICFSFLIGCTGNKADKKQDAGVKSVEIDDSNIESNDNISSGDDKSGDITYEFRNPEDSENIVVTPRE